MWYVRIPKFRDVPLELHEELREGALATLGEGSSVRRDARPELQPAALARVPRIVLPNDKVSGNFRGVLVDVFIYQYFLVI